MFSHFEMGFFFEFNFANSKGGILLKINVEIDDPVTQSVNYYTNFSTRKYA